MEKNHLVTGSDRRPPTPHPRPLTGDHIAPSGDQASLETSAKEQCVWTQEGAEGAPVSRRAKQMPTVPEGLPRADFSRAVVRSPTTLPAPGGGSVRLVLVTLCIGTCPGPVVIPFHSQGDPDPEEPSVTAKRQVQESWER